MTDHTEKTKAMIAVMQAYVDGKPIESCTRFSIWVSQPKPAWNWAAFDYRIATTPDTIDWSHVAPEWKYMARDRDGTANLYHCAPVIKDPGQDKYWVIGSRGGDFSSAKNFSSYVLGSVDWKDSLVSRPE